MNKQKYSNIIFDLGGVLIDWNPEYLYKKVFDDKEQMNWFLTNVCHSDWNVNQDAGVSVEKATQEKVSEFPDWEKHIKMFYGRWEEMLGGEISGTVAILDSLIKNKDLDVFALTNWSAETFPIAQEQFKFLSWFKGILVSGEEKTRKPFREIYQRMMNKFDLIPSECLFIDDNLENVEAAEAFGIKSILFKSPSDLKIALVDLKIDIK